MDTQAQLTARALALLDRAVIDQDKAEHGRAPLYRASERWDFVRGARELLKLSIAEAEPAAKSLADVLA
jgi:hypothetical protein